jgi:site-specific recombinase XerD
MRYKTPSPIFDSLEYFDSTIPMNLFNKREYQLTKMFLKSYCGSAATFNAYRREVERFMQWSWYIAKKTIKSLRRDDIVAYIEFCQQPPASWIGLKKPPRFIVKNTQRLPNPEWRPFLVTISKAEYRKGKKPNVKKYQLSEAATKEIFAILSTYYNFLITENYTEINPLLQVRQKSRFLRRSQTKAKIRRLSDTQWQYVIQTAEAMADKFPELHERTLFIMNALFALYLRISELAASQRWTPKMNDFYRDQNNYWWFKTVGKGNKERDIAVSDEMLHALKRWRRYLNLTLLPSSYESMPLLPKSKGQGPITSTTYIREIVQDCFDQAIIKLRADNKHDEAESLLDATVHWLRHTGISEDVKRRPREHVRDDAGHSSSAITDRYIDVELKARYKSAQRKPIKSYREKYVD